MLFPNTPGRCDACQKLQNQIDDDNFRLKMENYNKSEHEYKQYLLENPGPFDVDEHFKWLKAKMYPNGDAPTPQELEYAFTLTTNLDSTTREELLFAVEKLFRNGRTYKNEPIKRGAYCVEYTDAGRPHIHGVYTTGSERRITAKSFNRAWKLWDEKKKQGNGHQGGYHSLCTNSQKYSEYIAKGDGLGHNPDLFIVPDNNL